MRRRVNSRADENNPNSNYGDSNISPSPSPPPSIILPDKHDKDDFDTIKKRQRQATKSLLLLFLRSKGIKVGHVLSTMMIALICFGCLLIFLLRAPTVDPRFLLSSQQQPLLVSSTTSLQKSFSLVFPRMAANTTTTTTTTSIHQVVLLQLPEPPTETFLKESKYKYYGGLDIKFFKYDDDDQVRQRSIYMDERDEYDYYFLQEWDVVHNEKEEEVEFDTYYAFDDDVQRNPFYDYYDDDSIHERKKCRRTNWHRDLPINCNTLHEFHVSERFLHNQSSFLGKGDYREAYLSQTEDLHETVIFKAYRWKSNFEEKDFEYMRIDAQVLEIMTPSEHIVDIYGFCGTSIINQAIMGGHLEDHIYRTDYDEFVEELMHNNKRDQLTAISPLSDQQKLQYAYGMAQSLAELHGYENGVIVHDDVKPDQWLLDEEGQLYLSDFSRGEVMLYDVANQEYCRYMNNPGGGTWRAPEEYFDWPLNEQIDVWSLGNNFYSLLTGHEPFWDENLGKLDIIEAVKAGRTSYIDPRFLDLNTATFVEKTLAELIPLCWAFKADDRIDVFELVQRLGDAMEENNRRMEQQEQRQQQPRVRRRSNSR